MNQWILLGAWTALHGCYGPAGVAGYPGPQGPSGEAGPQGQAGEQGPPGEPGQDGADGQDGANGQDGADGQDGINGQAAEPGASWLRGGALDRWDDSASFSWTPSDDGSFGAYELRASDSPGVDQTATLVAEITDRYDTELKLYLGGVPSEYSYYRLFTVNTSGDRMGSNEVGLTGLHLETLSFGAPGSGDGALSYPSDVAVDAAGNMYVADSGNHRIAVFDATGAWTHNFDGTGSPAGGLNTPYMLELGGDGNLYVSSHDNNQIVVFQPDGTYVDHWTVNQPGDLVVLPNGDTVVTAGDTGHWFDAARDERAAWWITADNLWDIELDPNGWFVALDQGERSVGFMTASGVEHHHWWLAGTGEGQLDDPWGLAVAADGRVYISDWHQGIKMFTNDGIYLGLWTDPAWTGPWGMDFGPNGELYVVSAESDSVHVYGP